MPEAGKFRNRITVETQSLATDAFNQQVQAWADAGERWARIEPVIGQERVIGDRFDSLDQSKFTLRNSQGDDQVDWRRARFVYRSRNWYPISQINPEEASKIRVFICTTSETA